MSDDIKKGGSFLVEEATPESIFVPENFSSEQLMYAKTARDFIENEVIEKNDEIEEKNFEVSKALMAKAGELGLLMADVPEEYGGMGLDKASSALITESMSGQGSFSVIYGAHVGIATLPIVYYGTEEQKEKYLPGLADGTKIGAYCLTETGAGSDALAARTKAVLSEDGKYYILNGSKQFITNGGLAFSYIVFAKIDGEKFTAFILDRDTEGLKIGPEEHKMGIRGSSTTTVILEDAKVPVENVLGEVGQGHKIAFNVLNIGRFKLGAGSVGANKVCMQSALEYAMERKQFGKPISDFGMIREKLAEMYVRTYAAESAVYRTVGMIDTLALSAETSQAKINSIEEYSIECAIVKVLASEALDFVTDEYVQILGGYGFCSEYAAEKNYRDARINRIFEGTNEVNRLLIPAMLLRKGMKGELPLFQAATALQEELMGIPSFDLDEDLDLLAAEKKIVANLKKICLFVAGVAAQKFGTNLADQQMVLSRLADIAIKAYAAESTLVRALKDAANRGEEGAALPLAVARIYCENAIADCEKYAREALAGIEEGDALATMLAALRRLMRRTPANTLAARETIAAKLIQMERIVY
ncbi:MAG: acyl-CoA dehydrogenase [Deltaproteobacteria bacterium]|mgnify:CR=1 FL=1|nr:MAG: acyl-CoA dehydrogenase [Deltaproteobacteria bacterium]